MTTVDTTTSGLEQLRSLMGEGGPGVGISRLLGMELEVLEEGRVAFSAQTRADMGNAIGVVHGGIAATLLDSALGCSVHSTLKPGERYTTVDLHVHYTRAIAIDLGKIVATGEVVHRGSRVATAEGRLVDLEGKLLAHGTTTCVVLPA
jgi:acyl-CoA thioesterase